MKREKEEPENIFNNFVKRKKYIREEKGGKLVKLFKNY